MIKLCWGLKSPGLQVVLRVGACQTERLFARDCACVCACVGAGTVQAADFQRCLRFFQAPIKICFWAHRGRLFSRLYLHWLQKPPCRTVETKKNAHRSGHHCKGGWRYTQANTSMSAFVPSWSIVLACCPTVAQQRFESYYRRKFRSETSDNMDSWKAEVRRVRREKIRRKKMQMREKVGKSRFTVFFQWFVALEGRKVGSLKRRVRSQLARWEMKNCTPLWREAHFQVKMYKTHQVRTTFGSWDVEKVHAVVARSTFPSQKC